MGKQSHPSKIGDTKTKGIELNTEYLMNQSGPSLSSEIDEALQKGTK